MKIKVLAENTAACAGIGCEHGLSLYIETGSHRILFDAGQTNLFSDNAAAMGIDLSKIDVAILSHGHYDHSGGLLRFLSINDHASVYMNEHAFSDCWHGTDHYIGIDPALKASGRIILTGDEFRIDKGLSLCTCNERPRLFPSSGQGLTIRLEDGSFIQDEFLHEQYLLIEEAGHRVLISGCSHKGILNIMHWLRPDVLIGGFHFMKLDPVADSETLKSAADMLNGYDTQYYTCHCTGVEPFEALKGRMGERLHYLSAGGELTLKS